MSRHLDPDTDPVTAAIRELMALPEIPTEEMERRARGLASLAKARRALREVRELEAAEAADDFGGIDNEQRLRDELFDRLAARARALGLAPAVPGGD